MERTRGKKNEEIYGPGDREQIETSGFLTGRQSETIARYIHISTRIITPRNGSSLSREIERERRLSALVILTNAPTVFHAPFEIESPAGGQRVVRPASAPAFRVALHRRDKRFSEDPDLRASGRTSETSMDPAGTDPAGKRSDARSTGKSNRDLLAKSPSRSPSPLCPAVSCPNHPAPR